MANTIVKVSIVQANTTDGGEFGAMLSSAMGLVSMGCARENGIDSTVTNGHSKMTVSVEHLKPTSKTPKRRTRK